MTPVLLRKLVWTVASADDRFNSIIRYSTYPFERAAAYKRLKKLDSFVNELAITGVYASQGLRPHSQRSAVSFQLSALGEKKLAYV